LIRQTLKNLGDTWLTSPWRRVVQASFFALFVVLFVYVCWPYGGSELRAASRCQGDHPGGVLFDH
jgi:hypothetical protein